MIRCKQVTKLKISSPSSKKKAIAGIKNSREGIAIVGFEKPLVQFHLFSVIIMVLA